MLADDIVTFLAAEGIGTVGTDLIATTMPDDPDACGAVYETGGFDPEYALGGTEPALENPTAQIVFRGAPHDYDGPRAKAESAFKAIGKLRSAATVSGYYLAQPLQSPFPFNRRTPDPKERPLIAFNVAFQKEPSTT